MKEDMLWKQNSPKYKNCFYLPCLALRQKADDIFIQIEEYRWVISDDRWENRIVHEQDEESNQLVSSIRDTKVEGGVTGQRRKRIN